MAWWSRTKDKKKAAEQAGAKRSVPSGLFQKCDGCGATVDSEKVRQTLWCCPSCGHHFALPTDERIRITVDEDSFVEEDTLIQPEDPLLFRDSKRYVDRLRAAQKQTGVADAFREELARVRGGRGSVRMLACRVLEGTMIALVVECVTS